MASTYTTNLGIEKIATGEQSGTWGATTNTNLDLIDQAVNGVVQITVAATGSTGSPNALTITNGSASDGRNKFIDFYSPTDLGGTVYYQLDPNDAEKIAFVRNSLGGGQTLVLFQGTYNASNDVEVPNGVDMLVKFDGTGASATVTNVFEKLQVNALSVNDGNITNVGDIALDSISADGTDINVSVSDNSATALTVKEGSNTYLTIDTTNSAEKVLVSKTLDIGDNNITNVGNIALDSISADGTQIDIDITDNTASAFTISEGANNYIAITTTDGSELITVSKNSTFAGTTIADLGVVTTVDINGGTIDGVTIGGASAGAITGTTITGSDDALINGLTVGEGAGSISTNVAVGQSALAANTTGNTSTALGYRALRCNTEGTGNTATGITALCCNTTASFNTATGRAALSFNTTGANNTATGSGALCCNTTASFNTAAGANALVFNTTGPSNTAMGFQALAGNTTGALNTAMGRDALASNVEGDQSVAVGYQALYKQNPAANADMNNTAVGYQAAACTTTGANNTAVGAFALCANTTGCLNTAVGRETMLLNTTGCENSAFGRNALRNNTTGINNTAIGSLALVCNVEGDQSTAVGFEALAKQNPAANADMNNTAVGYQAAACTTTGTSNTAIGTAALFCNTTASSNTAVGSSALAANTTGTRNTALGRTALQTNITGNDNTSGGYFAMYRNTTGCFNTAFGSDALYENTTANSNTAVGFRSLRCNTEGSNNTAVGCCALTANTTGGSNTASGVSALAANTTASNNTAMGFTALCSNITGGSNTASGVGALRGNTEGASNTATGVNALIFNTTGSNNTAVGESALRENTTAGNNTAVGFQAGYNNTTGSVVAVGYQALYANTTGTNNIAIGYQASDSITEGGDNVVIGNSAGASATTANGNVFIGSNAGAFTTGGENTFIGSGVTGVDGGAGFYVTTGSKNTIIGKYDGNQGGLDIRTASNYIVLSDGDGNPRGVFDGSGNFLVGTTDTTPAQNNVAGAFAYRPTAQLEINGNATQAAFFGRTDDGMIIGFYSAGTREGDISVSGTTVSYNGGHLARWSRLEDDSKDTSIVKGTVMTNLDAMVEWGDEDNEQLNKMAVSSVEGDPNVAGVFVNWDNDDDFNDMNIAMTGDMVIRIAQGVTVERGDLLMSAGDGTAKPQGDDIVRSKTIAKVTSTHVSHTYADGSYCVPCVLMAC
jgi:hypothetical protein